MKWCQLDTILFAHCSQVLVVTELIVSGTECTTHLRITVKMFLGSGFIGFLGVFIFCIQQQNIVVEETLKIKFKAN